MGHAVDADVRFEQSTVPGAPRAPLRALFAPEWRVDTFALWGAFVSCLFAVYLGFGWLPTIFAAAGFGPATASSAISAFNLGGVVGAIAGGLVIARFGSRVPMLVMTGAAAAGALVLSRITIAPDMVAPTLAVLTVTGGLINGVQTTMYALAAHVYPTLVRATGVGSAVAVGRLGAILSGFAGAWSLDYAGSASFFAVMAGALIVTFVSLATVRRHIGNRRMSAPNEH
jgi:AAHS family 4-hydroxybenzoate transporter-like MFS transporter